MKIMVTSLLVCFWIFLLSDAIRADVVPGETIDKTNYQKIQELVPDFIVTWVKNGDMKMKIGKLSFDQHTFWPQEVLENWQANMGRYKIDENNGIIDDKTGKPARGIKGLPFPEPDMKDPKLPMMLLWNRDFNEFFLRGDTHHMDYWLSCTRAGLEKSMVCEALTHIFDPAQTRYDFAELDVFRQPFSMAGIGTLAIFPLYPLENGERFTYAPVLGKIRRMSHRLSGSDAIFGVDAVPDDAWAGGPKTAKEEGIYRFIGERDALVPYLSETPIKARWNEKKELGAGNAETGFEAKMGFETPGWTGAPWHVTNVVWVKSRVYVFESRSKDKNYAYGPCEGWIEKGSFSQCYKRIVDPNGKLWKGWYWPAVPFESPDGTYRLIINQAEVVVDMRRDHGTCYPGPFRKGGFARFLIKNQNETLFTRGGFAKFSK
jgi:hypothetical protein